MKSWFENRHDIKWLLVTNNGDKLQRDLALQRLQVETIGNIIPRGQSGCVLVTSHDKSALGQLASDGHELLVMREDEATEVLLKCSKVDSMEFRDATALVKELG